MSRNTPPDVGKLVNNWTDAAMQLKGLVAFAEDNLPELDDVVDDEQASETRAAFRAALTAAQAALGAYTMEYQRLAAHQQTSNRFGTGYRQQPSGYQGGGRATVNAPVPGHQAPAPAPASASPQPQYQPQPQPAQQVW